MKDSPDSLVRRRLAGATAALLTCLIAGAARGEQEAGDGERAAALQALGRGDELREAGRCGEAIAAWRQGLRQTDHWVFFARIGDCYRREGHHERAVAYLQMALERGGPSPGLPAPMRRELETAVEQCRAALPARLQVATTVGDAQVVVDGRPRGEAPLSMEIARGDHNVTALREGSEAPIVGVRGRPGHVASIVMPLEPTSTAEERSDEGDGAASRARGRASDSPRRLLGGLLLAAGAVIAGGGAWLACWDGSPLDTRDAAAYDAFAPGVGVSALGVGLVIGSIVLLALPPWEGGAQEDSR